MSGALSMGALSAGFGTVSLGPTFSKDQELMSTQPLLLQSRCWQSKKEISHYVYGNSYKPIVTFEISNVCLPTQNPFSICINKQHLCPGEGRFHLEFNNNMVLTFSETLVWENLPQRPQGGCPIR